MSRDDGPKLRIGTRGSALARWQADYVRGLLKEEHSRLDIEIEIITTRGDRILASPLPVIGGKGVFTAELEDALLGRQVDIAVHSIKDIPTQHAAGLTMGAIPRRAESADVLVSRDGYTLETLPSAATVGTSSPRRASQLLHVRPDLNIADIRGNVDTRIRKAHDPAGVYDAVLLAYAGLERLGRLDAVSQVLEPDQMLPAPGQGALGVQCRDDEASLALVRTINDTETELAVIAERAFLSDLGGGCALPISALGVWKGHELHLRGRVTSRDGSKQIDVEDVSAAGGIEDACRLGMRLAEYAIAEGAHRLLDEPR